MNLLFREALLSFRRAPLRNEDDVSFEKTLPEVNFQMIETNLPELNQYRQLKIRNKKNL